MEQDVTATAPVMDSGKQKDGKGWKIATVIASVAAVCGIGFGVYGIMQSSDKDGQISDLRAQIQESDNMNNVAIDDKTTTIITDSIVTPKSYGFVTDNFVSQTEDATMKQQTMFGATFSLTSNGDVFVEIFRDDCGYYGDTCEDGHYKRDITSLIPGNVVDMSINRYGNGGMNWVFFALDDGTVVSLSEYDAIDGKQAVNVEGSKDIFRLFGSYGYAQNTSGKIYSISPADDTLEKFKIDE